jgi:hypothetical protein
MRLLSERAEAKRASINLPSDFQEYGNYDKALWLYQYAQDLFMAALSDCEIEDMTSWITYRVPLVEKMLILSKTSEIASFVSDHYRNGGRGKHCRAIPIEKQHFVGITARPLNYTRNEESYDEKGKPVMKKIASVFEVYFLYIPIKGEEAAYLSVKVKDGGKANRDVEALATYFTEKVLGTTLHERSRVRYKLHKLENMNVIFDGFDDEDGVESVNIKEIVLDHPECPAKIVLRTKRGTTSKNMEDIAKCLEKLSIKSLEGYRIVNAIFRFQFKKGKEGKRDWKSKGVVIASVNTNKQSSCNLGISEPHLIARKYLRRWKIEHSV